MRSKFKQALLGSLFLVSLAAVGSPSQAQAQEAQNVPDDSHDDDGFDKGWLGLLGLAGLLGLKRREQHEINRRDVNRPETSRV